MFFRNSDKANVNIKIIGFGNIYMGDDGIGIYVIRELEKLEYFSGCDLIDGGTSAADLIYYLKNSIKVVLIDAVDAGQEIGGISIIKPGNIEEFITDRVKSYSLHDFDLSEVLKLVIRLGLDSKLVIIGVKPEWVDFGEHISNDIKKKIPEIIEKIKKEVCM
jgi:hydrogenase maturation protease